MYLDYREMLVEESLDIVSICTWPHLHPEMVLAAAIAGIKAIHWIPQRKPRRRFGIL